MKIINKKAKFGRKQDQKFYHERFENYDEFYRTIMKRQDNARKTLEDVFNQHDKDWTGVQSVEQAKDMLLNGWSKNVDRLKQSFNQELNTLENNKAKKTINSVAGFMPIVPNALMGLPNSMISMKLEPKKSKIFNFMIAIDRACNNSVETIIEKMSKIFAYIAMLERSGQYRCRIEVFFTAYGGSERSGTNTSVSVLVKNENQLFDIKRVCYPVIHPSMLRLFAFAWEESLPLDYDDYRVCGYGTSFEHWNDTYKQDFINMVNEKGEKTICLDLFSNIKEKIEKEVK